MYTLNSLAENEGTVDKDIENMEVYTDLQEKIMSVANRTDRIMAYQDQGFGRKDRNERVALQTFFHRAWFTSRDWPRSRTCTCSSGRRTKWPPQLNVPSYHKSRRTTRYKKLMNQPRS